MAKGITIQELDTSAIKSLVPHLGTTTNSGNAYSITTTEAIKSDQKFTIKINATSTGAATLNVSSIGSSKGIKKPGGADANLKIGVYTLYYDGMSFQLLGEGGDIEGLVPDVIKQGIVIDEIVGTFTADATATVNDISLNKVAYVQGQKIVGTLKSFAVGASVPISKLSEPKLYSTGTIFDLTGAVMLLSIPEQRLYYRTKGGYIQRVSFEGVVLGEIAINGEVLYTYDKTHFIYSSRTENIIRKIKMDDFSITWSITVTDISRIQMIGNADSHDFVLQTTANNIRKYDGMTGLQTGQTTITSGKTSIGLGRNVFCFVEGARSGRESFVRFHNISTNTLLFSIGPINTYDSPYSDSYDVYVYNGPDSLIDLIQYNYTSYNLDSVQGYFVGRSQNGWYISSGNGTAPRNIAYRSESRTQYGGSWNVVGENLGTYAFAPFGGLVYTASGSTYFVASKTGENTAILLKSGAGVRSVAYDPTKQTVFLRADTTAGGNMYLCTWDGGKYVLDPVNYSWKDAEGSAIYEIWTYSDGVHLIVRDSVDTTKFYLMNQYPSRKILP